MSPTESSEELARRYERERRATELEREDRLHSGLGNFRVGSVPFLNAVPLTRGLEEHILLAPPAELAEKLRRDELDAALVSVTEVLFQDRYDVLDGIAVASLGEVRSVFVAHRGPIEKAQIIYCDRASLTSVHLLRVLLGERGLNPKLEILDSYDRLSERDYLMLIGDRAIDFTGQGHPHQIWDLGAAWYDLTRLPFVYAVWALRRGVENSALKQQLREAKSFGLDTLDAIIEGRKEFDADFRRDYLTWHIHYHLGTDERRGLARFIELLRKHSDGRPVYEPRFVS